MRNPALACAVIVCLLGCGGDSKSPAAPAPTPAPTPTPEPNYSGTYSGSILFNIQGQAEVRGTGRTVVTHTGNALSLGSLTVTALGTTTTYGLGSAIMNGNVFAGTDSYQSAGCGRITTNMNGHFAGRLMNLTARFTSTTRGCDPSEIRGELARP